MKNRCGQYSMREIEEKFNEENCIGYLMKKSLFLDPDSRYFDAAIIAWNLYVSELKQSIKDTSSRLLESFRILKITSENVFYILRYTTIYLE